MTTKTLDPVTVTVIKNALREVASEMDTTIEASAFSPVISESRDRSSGIYDVSTGGLLAQGSAPMLYFNGIMQYAVRSIIDMGVELGPGDVLLTNDPYVGGSHLNDVKLLKAVYVDGESRMLLGNVGHLTDIGGAVAGSFNMGATDVTMEGLRMPAVKLVREGEIVQDVWDMILANIRTAEESEGDLKALIACLNVGEERLRGLFDRFGLDTVMEAVDELRRRSKDQMRELISSCPDGIYSFEHALDNDGIGEEPLWARADVTVAGDRLIVNLDRSSDTCRGPFNASLGNTIAGVYCALVHLFPEVSVNEGTFEPIDIEVREGSFLNARYPAAVSGSSGEVTGLVTTVVLGALAAALPERSNAGCYFSVGVTTIASEAKGEIPSIMWWFTGGGYGGYDGGDGLTNACTVIGISKNPPLEILEQRFPVRVRRFEVSPDSGGAGKWRGGLGGEIEFELLGETGGLSVMTNQTDFPSWGFGDGATGGASRTVYIPADGESFEIGTSPRREMHRGDRILMSRPGGGGWGDPLDRAVDLVEDDVARGHVTVAAALDQYAVVIGDDGTADRDATDQERARRRESK